MLSPSFNQSRSLIGFYFGFWFFLLFAVQSLLSPAQAMTLEIPHFATVKSQHLGSDQWLLDKQGAPLAQTRLDLQQRQGRWLEIADMSPALIQLVLHAEDRRFYEHHGVDWYAVAGTTWSALWGQRLRGTSTLSMQLVDLLGLGVGRSLGQRSWSAKWQQARLAQQLEQQWSKTEILEAYLNLVPFRGELVGVDAMARVLWQKQAFALSLPEAALAVAMLPRPNTTVDQLQQRSCMLWRELAPEANCTAQRWYNQQALQRGAKPAWASLNIAPHLAHLVMRTTSAPTVHTSIDKTVQQQAQHLMQQQLSDLRRANVNDAAVLVLDNMTGQVLAYVGSSTQSRAPDFDHVQAKRQAGSTLKPFLYQYAIGQNRITAASLLDDTAVQFSTPYGVYVPQNYDEQFIGWVSARVALASSLNIPAVRLLSQVGVDDFHTYLQELGFDLPYAADYYGLGLALGGVEVSLWQLVNAYRSLANLGVFSQACFLMDCNTAETGLQLASPEASWVTQNILSDNTARAMTFGLDSPLSTPFWTAVKTGTSKDMRDNWVVGFSQHYTVGVWVGNTDGSAMHDVSGVSGAAPIWHKLMGFLHTSVPSLAPSLSDVSDVLCQKVRFVNHWEAVRTECFSKGSERSEVVLEDASLLVDRIVSPVHQTVYAFDPDIPVAKQRLTLAAQLSAERAISWHINGQLVSTAMHFFWSPAVGQHRIELIDTKTKKVIDAVSVQFK